MYEKTIFASKSTAKDRFQICKECDKLRPFVMMCSVCNCFMPIKVTISSTRCPIGKWEEAEIDPDIKDYYRADKET